MREITMSKNNTSSNDKLFNEIEAKLFQMQSIAKTVLNNHNHKSAGYDEPLIEHTDVGNLLWAVIDLADNASTILQELEFKKDDDEKEDVNPDQPQPSRIYQLRL